MNRNLKPIVWALVVITTLGLTAVSWMLWDRSHGLDVPPEASRVSPAARTESVEGSNTGDQRLQAGVPAQSSAQPPTGDAVVEIYGFVLDADGAPAGAAAVETMARGEHLASAQSNGEFSFQLQGRSAVVRARRGTSTSPPTVVSAIQSERALILQLAEPAILRVHVIAAATRKPLAGATVRLAQSGAEEVQLSPAALAELQQREWQTDAGGDVELPLTFGGRLVVAAHAAGHAGATRSLVLSSASSGTRAVTLALSPEVIVRGKVSDPHGQPVSAAQVTARDSSSHRAAGNAQTDSDGRFQLNGLYHGTFRFEAALESVGTATTPLIVLERPTHDVNIRLQNDHELAGRVIDAEQRPVAAALVQLSPRADGFYRLPEERRQVSDEQGRFRFPGVSTPRARVTASLGELLSPVAEVNVSDAVELVLKLEPSDSISGAVVDAANAPIPGAHVMGRLARGSEGALDERFRESVSATTDAQGRFELKGLRDGHWSLFARSPDDLLSRGMAEGEALRTATPGARDVVLVVPGSGALEGWVEFEDGSLPSEATVVVSGRPLVSPSGGSFYFQGIPAGTHDVTVTGSEFEPTRLSDIEVRANETTALEAIRVRKGRRVTGTVVRAGHTQVAGAKVVASSSLNMDARDAHGREIEEQPDLRASYTDENGRFELAGLTEGRLAIMAEHPSHGRSAVSPLPPPGAAPVELVLVPTGSVAGKVTRAGAGLEGFAIIAKDSTDVASVTALSGPDGRYQLTSVPAGRYTITAANQRPGSSYGLQQRAITLGAGETQVVDFELAESTVRVLLDVPAGMAAPGPAVLRGSSMYIQPTPVEGVYIFPEVAAGQYDACVVAQAAEGEKKERRCDKLVVKADAPSQSFRF